MPRKRTEPMSTTHARKRKTNWKRRNQIRIATWNIKSLNNREQELIEELKERNIDICALQETKKKGKGQKDYGDYFLIYSGVQKEKRAAAGVGLLLHKKFKDHIIECNYFSERILSVKLNTKHQKINVISIYAPEECKPRDQRENFYEDLQHTIDAIHLEETIFVLGDFNARIGQEVIPEIKQKYHEEHTNDNGELMVNFCSFNNLRINNTYYNHEPKYKYTFENSRGQESMIDYIVTNKKVHPSQILDIRTLNSANVGSDHKLLLGKIRMEMKQLVEHKELALEEKFNVEALWNDSTKDLYQRRLSEKTIMNPITPQDSIDDSWNKLRENIDQAARESLGTRMVKTNKRPSKTPWFRKEIKEKCKEKRKAYLEHKSINTQQSLEKYKQVRNETNSLIRKLKSEYWEVYSKRLESDFYGQQKQIWRLMRQQRKETSELIETNQIDEDTWINYLTDLFKRTDDEQEEDMGNIRINEDITVTREDVETALKKLKNRKSPGQDKIPNELLKYGGENLTKEMVKLINKILTQNKIPDSWRISTIILMFKKGDKKDPSNFRGINLLSTTLKLVTKIITTKINSLTTLAEEQQGFRTGRSCTDAVFIMRQVVEKSIEYNKPAFICFIDLKKAFDRIQLKDVIYLLSNRGISTNLTKTIQNIYTQNKIQARLNGKLTATIPVDSGIRQGDSLSPLLFNIIMDEIIERTRKGKGYRMSNKEITIICYADDAVLFAESEDDLQKNLHLFNKTAKHYNMIISTEKTKCMTTSKEPLRCKLEIDGNIVEQVMSFRYLGVELSSYGDIEKEVTQQVNKANKVAGCLNDTIWRNKHLNINTKSRIYKSTIRPIMTYIAETRPDTSKTKRLLETAEMKVLRRIAGKTLWDRERSESIRRTCEVQNIGEWTLSRKKEWNAHIERMTHDRIVKIARDKSPEGRRSIGRPRRRWSDNLEPD